MSRTSEAPSVAETTIAPSGNKRIVLKKDNMLKTNKSTPVKVKNQSSKAGNLKSAIAKLPKEMTRSNVSLDEKSEISNVSALSDAESDRV